VGVSDTRRVANRVSNRRSDT